MGQRERKRESRSIDLSFLAPALTLHSGRILTLYRSQLIKADHLTDNRTSAEKRALKGPGQRPSKDDRVLFSSVELAFNFFMVSLSMFLFVC